MSSFRSYFTAGVAALASSLVIATGASAQTALTNGVTFTPGAPIGGDYNSVNLGSTPGTGWATHMPMSLSYADVNLNISFTAGSGVVRSGTGWNPTPGSNFIVTSGGALTTFAFSSAQRYFGFAWSSADNGNNVEFYNGNSLIASMSGAAFRSAAGLSVGHSGASASFSFSELAFDRVVMSTSASGAFEAGGVTFASTAPEVAPIPLGGVGGMVALLGMFALRRGYGGHLPQRLLAFASGGRRQQVQRFA